HVRVTGVSGSAGRRARCASAIPSGGSAGPRARRASAIPSGGSTVPRVRRPGGTPSWGSRGPCARCPDSTPLPGTPRLRSPQPPRPGRRRDDRPDPFEQRPPSDVEVVLVLVVGQQDDVDLGQVLEREGWVGGLVRGGPPAEAVVGPCGVE